MSTDLSSFEDTKLNIIYIALITGQILFAGIAYFLNYSESIENTTIPYFKSLVLLVSLTSVFMSYLLPKMMIKRLTGGDDLLTKLNTFKSSFILKMALLEGANLFVLVYFLISGDIHSLIVVGLILLIQFFHYPSKKYIIKELSLNDVEQDQFLGKETYY